MSEQMSLFDLGFAPMVVHCCFCPHVETGWTADGNHDAMERHYAARHSVAIARIVGTLR